MATDNSPVSLLRPSQCLKLEREADSMRYLLDLLTVALDGRLPESARVKAAMQLVEAGDGGPHLYRAASNSLDVFRDVANRRTDGVRRTGA